MSSIIYLYLVSQVLKVTFQQVGIVAKVCHKIKNEEWKRAGMRILPLLKVTQASGTLSAGSAGRPTSGSRYMVMCYSLISYNLYPISYVLYLISYILHLESYILYLISYTLNLISYILYFPPVFSIS